MSRQTPNAPAAPGDQWKSQAGFILATVGSAAGVGNVWRFSYVAGENGGGTFLLLYILSVLLIGFPLILAETGIGRALRYDSSPQTQRLTALWHWRGFRLLAVLTALAILSFYAVIAGWSLRYFVGALDGSLLAIAATGHGEFFAAFIADPAQPVIWQGAMMLATTVIVMRGVQRGIELANRILMPALFAAVVLLALYGVTQTGASGGLRFLFAPDWSVLGEPQVYLAAMGQAFFSLGVGMAIFVTYGRYMSEGQSVPLAAGAVVLGDTLVALFAGIAIFTTVFAYGTDPAAGPQLAFITLPHIFLALPGGQGLAALFFGLLVAGALTSMISLLEVPVAWLIEHTGWSRRSAAIALGLLIFLLGIPSALGFGALSGIRLSGLGILDAIDFVASNIMLPVGGLMLLTVVGWRWGRAPALAAAGFDRSVWGAAWFLLVRWVTPALTAIILLRELIRL
ncbi:MAG: sodium-dependent transporter [Alphaproteobacteria bacterium]